MLTVVLYDPSFGNTARIAQAIAHGAGTQGSVRVLSVAEATQPLPEQPDRAASFEPSGARDWRRTGCAS